MRVLLVEDPKFEAQTFKRRLQAANHPFVVSVATSSTEALGRLSAVPYDVVIVDDRLGEDDPLLLLERISQRCPETVRVLISADLSDTTLQRALRFAHQVVRRDLEPNVLEGLLLQTATTLTWVSGSAMRRALGGLNQLPPQPRLYRELTLLLQRPNCSIDEVVVLLSRDATMAAKLLQLANSAFFLRRARTVELRAAVVRLGVNTIRNLLLSLELYEPGSPVARVLGRELEHAQKTSLRLAQMTEKLAAGTSVVGEAFVAGLLADIGQVVFILSRGVEWREARLISERDGVALHEVETARFGVSHAEVGAYLLGIWGLPFSLVEAVAHHHRPERICAPLFTPAAVTAIASALIDAVPLSDDWLHTIRAKTRVELVRSQLSQPHPS